MKKLLMAAGIAALMTSAGFAQLVPVGERGLIAGFNFNQLDEEASTGVLGTIVDKLGASSTELTLNGFAPPVRGTLHFDGTKGSEFWNGDFADEALGIFGTSVNSTVDSYRRGEITDDLFNNPLGAPGLGIGFNNEIGGQSAISFALDSSGFTGLKFSLAASAEDGSGSIAWSYQLVGGSKTSLGLSTNLGSTFSPFSFDLPTALENQGEFWLIGDLSGGLLNLDNVQLTGISAIPEPSTYAALLLGIATIGLVLFRRRKEA